MQKQKAKVYFYSCHYGNLIYKFKFSELKKMYYKYTELELGKVEMLKK